MSISVVLELEVRWGGAYGGQDLAGSPGNLNSDSSGAAKPWKGRSRCINWWIRVVKR